jgi:addiction module HigA family antidote
MKNPLPAIHPGCYVAIALEQLRLSNAQAARILQVSAAYVGDIINGKRNLSAAMCFKLAGFIGSTPEHWMSLQDQYDIIIAGRDKRLQVLKDETNKRFKEYRKDLSASARARIIR